MDTVEPGHADAEAGPLAPEFLVDDECDEFLRLAAVARDVDDLETALETNTPPLEARAAAQLEPEDSPRSEDAERAVLGALFVDPARIRDVPDLRAEHFFVSAHGAIFQAVREIVSAGAYPDHLLVIEELEATGRIDAAGGRPYVAELATSAFTTTNLVEYARIVRKAAQARQVRAIAVGLHDAAVLGADLDAVRADAVARIAAVPSIIRAKPSVLDLSNLAGRTPPERDWAMAWWFAMNTISLVVGAGGIGKTLLMMQIAACLALGRDFIDKVRMPRRVLMWCCEDDHDELWRRMVLIAEWLCVEFGDFEDRLIIVPRVGMDNVLYTSEHHRPIFTPAFEELRTQANDYRADAVILDNVAQLYGGDENDRGEVTRFGNGLLGAHRGRALALLGHPSKQIGSEYSGSTAWPAVARAHHFLGYRLPDQPQDTEAVDESVRFFCRRKANYGPKDYRRLTYQNSVLVPDADAPIAGGLMTVLRRDKAARVVLEGMEALARMAVRTVDKSNSTDFLPRVLIDRKLADDCTKKELTDAMHEHQSAGRIVRGVVGKYANRNPMEGLILCTK